MKLFCFKNIPLSGVIIDCEYIRYCIKVIIGNKNFELTANPFVDRKPKED